MDQVICASLSHTHYWYGAGMLKVPAVMRNRMAYIHTWLFNCKMTITVRHQCNQQVMCACKCVAFAVHKCFVSVLVVTYLV